MLSLNQVDNFHIQEEKDRIQVRKKKYVKFTPNKDLKTCGHILFDIVGLNFGS